MPRRARRSFSWPPARRTPGAHLARGGGGDGRRPDPDGDERPAVTAADVAQAVDRALLRYDRKGDEHYDVISAFIKSIEAPTSTLRCTISRA
jgi:hypothetical protein